MLKSLFFKRKVESEELLPPPPPFPSMDIEEVKPESKKETAQISKGRFDDLFAETEAKQAKKSKAGKEEYAAKGPEFEEDILDDLFEDAIPETKYKTKKGAKKAAKLKKGKRRTKDILKNLGIESVEPEKISPAKGFEFPDNLESIEMDVNSELHDLMQEPYHEITLDEQEIMEAIGKAKGSQRGLIGKLNQKLSLIRQKKAKTEAKVYDIMQQQGAGIAYGLESIQKRINDARNALMDFNLQRARESYIEIMNIYNHLKPEEQAKVYNEIRDLYFERKSAEQLKA